MIHLVKISHESDGTSEEIRFMRLFFFSFSFLYHPAVRASLEFLPVFSYVKEEHGEEKFDD